MNNKQTVGIIFGGQSVEHEISVKSAKNIYDAIDQSIYNVMKIGITKSGKWLLDPDITSEGTVVGSREISIIPGNEEHIFYEIKAQKFIPKIDVFFPVLHGTFGEDGTLQGMLKMLNVPFVGTSVLGSAIGIDKEVMKRLLVSENIPTAPYSVLLKGEQIDEKKYDEIVQDLGLPVFIKPARLGSSVGISKVSSSEAFFQAVKKGFEYDTKLLVEKYIKGREIECSVLGDREILVSSPGEIISQHEFYSYEAKYLDEKGAILKIPAEFSDSLQQRIKVLALQSYQALYLEGLARVDFFLTEDEDVFINEVNTMPGFTQSSMYPKLLAHDGISYETQVNTLIALAFKRFDEERALKRSFLD